MKLVKLLLTRVEVYSVQMTGNAKGNETDIPCEYICKTVLLAFSCGNVNWARRTSCNICNAPKFGVEEVRTGLGGGFKENENVEYVYRGDSDGEYDEFGRKKKKFRRQVLTVTVYDEYMHKSIVVY
jgi:hypothetical protein